MPIGVQREVQTVTAHCLISLSLAASASMSPARIRGRPRECKRKVSPAGITRGRSWQGLLCRLNTVSKRSVDGLQAQHVQRQALRSGRGRVSCSSRDG